MRVALAILATLALPLTTALDAASYTSRNNFDESSIIARGDVATQIGGSHVAVTSILSNPDQDPHLFEASPKTARALQHAQVVIYNGADYDPWMGKLLGASKQAKRATIVVANLVGKKAADNPHL